MRKRDHDEGQGELCFAPPLIVCYGMGVDSTAMLVGLHARGIRPDAILTADTGSEKPETYAYRDVMNAWLRKVDFPAITMVRYEPKNFKHWPAYHSLEENCLTNGTLPSLAFGFKSCSLKWKVAPMEKWAESWPRARAAWACGMKVVKAIGYDCSPADIRRRNHIGDDTNPKYHYRYFLMEWGWDRERCKAEIAGAGLPVPPKSACFFCPATKPAELHEMGEDLLRRIVRMEARAKPRLEGCMSAEELEVVYMARVKRWTAARHKAIAAGKPMPKMPRRPKVGDGCAGLWRSATKNRSAMMTDYIRKHALLPAAEIDEIIARTPTEIVEYQKGYEDALERGEVVAFEAANESRDYRGPVKLECLAG